MRPDFPFSVPCNQPGSFDLQTEIEKKTLEDHTLGICDDLPFIIIWFGSKESSPSFSARQA